ncbi:MAG TPA: RagB/SusD family nutrient uptake outer membrane protein, partial [Niastella sp.]
MRHILYSFLLIAIVGSSCQKKVLDIDPEDLLSSDLAFSTPEKIEANVIASYDGLQSKDFLSGRALIYVDLLAEDIFDRTTFFAELPRYNLLSNSSTVAGVWTAGYDAVGRANRAIAGITANSSKLTAGKAKELIAECKFVRAVSNFYLVNFFAQPYNFTSDASHPGIPLITASYTFNDPDANKPKSTVADIYTAVITDLTDAVADLPLTYNNIYNNKTRGTKAAASSFLSRVYLYKGDYTNARKFALDVINGNYGAFALNSTVDAAFIPANKYQTVETVWSIPNNINDNPNTNNALGQHYNPSARADLAISSTFLNETTNKFFAPDDKRRGLIISGAGSLATFRFTGKYTNLSDWAPIMRYAEV